MNIEAIQKAYAALKKEGIVKNPKKAFTIIREYKGVPEMKERRIYFASDKYATLIDILRRELEFPSFCAAPNGQLSPRIVTVGCKNLSEARKEVVSASKNLAELLETAQYFL